MFSYLQLVKMTSRGVVSSLGALFVSFVGFIVGLAPPLHPTTGFLAGFGGKALVPSLVLRLKSGKNQQNMLAMVLNLMLQGGFRGGQ